MNPTLSFVRSLNAINSYEGVSCDSIFDTKTELWACIVYVNDWDGPFVWAINDSAEKAAHGALLELEAEMGTPSLFDHDKEL